MPHHEITQFAWTSILAYSAIQGFLLFGIFLTSRKGSKSAKYLLAFLSLCSGLLLINGLISNHWGYSNFPHLIFVASPLWYVLGPLIYLYLRSYVRKSSLKWLDILHLLPFFFVIANTANFYSLPGEIKLYYYNSLSETKAHPTHNLNFLVFLAQNTFYLIFSGLLIAEGKTRLSQERDFRWVRYLFGALVIYSILSIFSLLAINHQFKPSFGIENAYFLLISASLLKLYLMSLHPEKGILFFGQPMKIPLIDLTRDQRSVAERVHNYLNESKKFRDPDFNLFVLSEDLKLSRHAIKTAIKSKTGFSFPVYLNQLRIADAKEKLKSPLTQQYTIQFIAQESGFRSLATFYRVFQKYEGTTPKTFIEQAVS